MPKIKKFPHYQQLDKMDCGVTCLKMIAKFYGKNISIYKLRKLAYVTKAGSSMLDLSEGAETIGFRTKAFNLTLEGLYTISLPCILHWQQNHYVILYKIKRGIFYIADPGSHKYQLNEKDFTDRWFAHKSLGRGLALQIKPTPVFYQYEDDEKNGLVKWDDILKYFFLHKRLISQIFLGLLAGTCLQLILPFLTQSVVDIGINTKNLNFIYLVLIAQLMLFLGQTAISFLQSWILLHISTRVNIAIVTDFFIKVMRLPMDFFEKKTSGDFLQRLNDQQRIETFLTGSTFTTIFSLFNLIIFGFVLMIYSSSIFFIFSGLTILYTLWIILFLKKRKLLDQKRFAIASDNQTKTFELINSIQEIKLNNSEKQKRWLWESLQARLFKVKVDGLKISQFQQIGAVAINQLKNILIIFISARDVITGQITLGEMMAIQYIVGMVNSPIGQLLSFIQSYQDAKISLERINEIYMEQDEEDKNSEWLYDVPAARDISFNNVSFRYPGAGNPDVLKNINLVFPQGKTTAIVGMSGSGKTTLIKLIMRFYKLDQGEILIGGTRLDRISFKTWRANCGMVMQNGYIFADTIENNIAVGDDYPDSQKIKEAIRIANLYDFIEEQPFGLQTMIGIAGKGISQGQQQRILIARAVYKEPHYILFDEATNALDAHNERIIIDNLRAFFKNRTVMIIAHRLSTVSYADNIVVINDSNIVEQGTHNELVKIKGHYFQLVKNQLELGN